MSMEVGRYQLQNHFKTTAARWEQTQVSWRDEVARDFDEKFWRPLEQHVKLTLAAMDQLGQIMSQVRRECS